MDTIYGVMSSILNTIINHEYIELEDDVVREFAKHNSKLSISYQFRHLSDIGINVYAIKNIDGAITDEYIRKLNVTSPYRYSLLQDGHLCANIFIDANLMHKTPVEFNSPNSISGDEFKHYLNNVLSMTINIIGFMYPQLEIDHRNMAGVVCTTWICMKMGMPISPQFLADAFGTNPTVAEAVIDKCDIEEDEIHGLPWYL